MWYKIDPDEFECNYTPTSYPRTTYLLSKTQWGTSHKTWRECCSNVDDSHAELIFMENRKCSEIVNRRTNTPCHITWYLSWTPCGLCAKDIINFLEEDPNVTLEILAARVYRPYDQRNQKGLKDLELYLGSRVQISIMDQNDYQYCWGTFVDHQGERYFPPDAGDIQFHSRRLDSMLYNF
ncbi:C-_U-editing enzyme APOBEC-1-like [Elgaria multicarinata webbii]|uniref:C->U-editing enzyme APOBEC-1-like n=1 Tax=Elgaria multicarinata webbii TaxID=159646 RepID=UPI002FCCDC60